MKYSRLTRKCELKKALTKLDKKNPVNKSGIPFLYEHKKMYIEDSEKHNLVIGSAGSGKTQAVVLPLSKLSILANENIIMNDEQSEVYKQLKPLLEQEKYKTIIIDTNEIKNHYNPLTLPYQYYKNNNLDMTKETLYEIANYIFNDNKTLDPFWINTSIDLFIGLSLHLLETTKKEITIQNISNEIINLDKINNYKEYLEKTINAPKDTKESIITVFKQKINLLTYKDITNELLSKTDFDLNEIKNNKTAIFFTGDKNIQNEILYPILISQIHQVIKDNKVEKRTNIIIDTIESFRSINNYIDKITTARSLNIRYTILTTGLNRLNDIYDNLMGNCGNIIYLLSPELSTLEEISKLCGRKNKNKELITIEELQRMKTFEAIILSIRMNPIKTKFIPDYKIDWNLEN